ncbi:MAG: hypothetical protein IJY36_08385 [Coprobacter sp.]|nr:hypothetical protein [Coprobacter sp.]
MVTLSVSKIADSKAFAFSLRGIALLSAIVAIIFHQSPTYDIPFLPLVSWNDSYIRLLYGGINLTALFLCCLLLERLNHTHTVMQQRTRLPITLLLVFNCFNPDIITTFSSGTILSPILLLMIYRLYGTYQGEGQYAAYSIGLLSVIGAIIFPPFLLLALPFGLGFLYMRSTGWRTTTAFILGIVSILWLIFCAYILLDFTYTPSLAELFPFTTFTLYEPIAHDRMSYFIAIAVIGLCCVVSATYFFSRHKIRIWLYNRFMVLLTICLLIIAGLDCDNVKHYTPLLNVIGALSASNFFLHTRNRYAFYIIGIIIIGYITLYIWNF